MLYIFLGILALQLFFIAFSLCGIFILRFLSPLFTNLREAKKKKIANRLIDLIKSSNPIEGKVLPSSSIKSLLWVLETFDRRFQGGRWEEVKEGVVKYHLLDAIEKLMKSPFWTKRSLAARICALYPKVSLEPVILELLSDNSFFVWSSCAIAAVKIQNKRTLFALIEKKAETKGYDRIFLRDTILLYATSATFSFLEELAEQKKGREFHLVIVDLLGSSIRTLQHPTFLQQDLDSQDPEIRVAAIRLLAHNPQKGAEEILLKAIQDKNPLIRAEAATGLSHFLTKESIARLQRALNDPVLNVQLRAAHALNQMTEQGKSYLESLKNTHPVARYVLQFS